MKQANKYLPCQLRTAVSITCVTAFIALVCPTNSQTKRPSWNNKNGISITRASETIPAFPRTLNGFRNEGNKDFWGKAFTCRGSLRVFKDGGWVAIPKFPATMNGCDAGVFMVRWRSGSADVRVSSAIGYFDKTAAPGAKTGCFGWMQGSNCEQPMFKFAGTVKGNPSTLVNVYYELKFWQAAP